MRNFFITFFCLFLLSCTTAQEIINRGEVKVGMSQDELRSVLLSTSLSEDPFLSGCFRQFFRNERALIVAAESRTTFFIFKNAYKQGTCKDINNGTLEAVRYSYQSALNYIQNNSSYLNNKDEYTVALVPIHDLLSASCFLVITPVSFKCLRPLLRDTVLPSLAVPKFLIMFSTFLTGLLMSSAMMSMSMPKSLAVLT